MNFSPNLSAVELVRDWCLPPSDARDHLAELTLALEGLLFSLPGDSEPYELLADAALRQSDGQPSVSVLADQLLGRWLTGGWITALPDRAQFNLLHLCANLEVGSLLVDKVWSLFDRRASLVTGTYLGTPLQSALLAAMIRNQPENSIKARQLWLDLLQDQGPADLPATLADGFFGFVRMPVLAKDDYRIAEADLANAATFIWQRAERDGRPDLFDRLLEFIPLTLPGLNLPRIKDMAMNFGVISRFEQEVTETVPAELHQLIDTIAREVRTKVTTAKDRFSEGAILTMLRVEVRTTPRYFSEEVKRVIMGYTTVENAPEGSLLGEERKSFVA